MENEQTYGYVYAIRATKSALVKIGYSKQPALRLRELQTASPIRLLLLASWSGYPEDERQLHLELKRYRARGEWFNLPLTLIQQLILMNEFDLPIGSEAAKLLRNSFDYPPPITGHEWRRAGAGWALWLRQPAVAANSGKRSSKRSYRGFYSVSAIRRLNGQA